MKTKLIIEEQVARLVMEAETDFERKMMEQVKRHKDHSLIIDTDEYFGRARVGSITVRFFTNSDQEQ